MAEEKEQSNVVLNNKDMLYDQSEVNYTTLSTTKGQACANCRWFDRGYCHIVENSPLAILPTGKCDQWTALPEPEDPQEELVEVLEAIEQGVNHMGAVGVGMMEHTPKKSFKERLLALVGHKEQPKARDEPFMMNGFKSLGNHKWIGWYSNNFADREKDIFPNAGIDAFISRVDKGISEAPTLRYWHVPVDIGKAKALARFALDDSPTSPSLVFAVGEYDDTPIARAFEAAVNNKSYGMSHGFVYPESAYQDGVYHVFDTFELSFLPPYAAANPYTLFGEETPMPVLDENKRKELVALLGDDSLVREFEQKADSRLKELKEQGIKHKEFTVVDTEARAQIGELTTAIKELVAGLKAAPPADKKKPADNPEEEDEAKADKMDKLLGGKKKELDDAFARLEAGQKALAEQLKAFNDLTPRQASRDKGTKIDTEDPAFKAFREQMEGGESTSKVKEFNQLFGVAFNANGNGG